MVTLKQSASKLFKTIAGIVLFALLMGTSNSHKQEQKQKLFANYTCGQHGSECNTFDWCKANFIRAYNTWAW